MCFSAKQPGVSLSGWSCLFVCLRVKIVWWCVFFFLSSSRGAADGAGAGGRSWLADGGSASVGINLNQVCWWVSIFQVAIESMGGGEWERKKKKKKYNKGKAKEIDYISKSEKGHPELYTYTAPGGSTISLLPSSLVFLNIFFSFFLFRHIKFSLFHLFFSFGSFHSMEGGSRFLSFL